MFSTKHSDNIFSRITRILEIVFTVQEHADSIRAVTEADIAMRLTNELDHLEHELTNACQYLSARAVCVQRLCHDAREHAHHLRHD